MRDQDDAGAITAALWRVMLDRGPGTIKRTEKAIGVAPDALRAAKNSEHGLRLKHVTGAIEALGIPASVFFDDVVGGVSTTAADRFMVRGAELAARGLVDLPALSGRSKADRLTTQDLERLDAARFEDPQAAAEQAAGIARHAARDGRHGDAVAAVARQGSALRGAELWDPAWVCVWWALRHAPDGPIRANAWLRSGSIVSDFGEFEDAAELAHLAMIGHAQCVDFVGVGPALANRGMFLRRAERTRQAIPVLQAALLALPASAKRIRFPVFQNLALADLRLGKLESATELADLSESITGMPTSFGIHVHWLRARIATGRSDYGEAIASYFAALPGLEDSPGDAALASTELCRVFLKAGESSKAVAVALGMASLALPKRQNPVVGAAIVDLHQSAQEGALSLDLAERVVRLIRNGLRRRAATAVAPRRTQQR